MYAKRMLTVRKACSKFNKLSFWTLISGSNSVFQGNNNRKEVVADGQCLHGRGRF